MRVGFLGPEGSFTEAAAKSVLPTSNHIPFPTIPGCMEAVVDEKVDVAIVPVENAIEGSVNLTLDYLIHKHTIPIVGEVTIPIKQHLLVHPDRVSSWRQIHDVYSHPQAIAQCHEFIMNELPDATIHYTDSTSSAAKDLKENPEKNAAAIANSLAAEKYGLTKVKEDIHDYDNNHTRFVLLSHSKTMPFQDEKQKTTLMVTLPSDYSGALHQVLSAFAWRKLNLSKIESRPMKTGIGNYFFIIDVEQEMDDVLIPGVQAELEALGCGVRVLGSYPCFLPENTPLKNPVPSK
ncbi:prephenate dehydratase [Alteribacillus iranensis]|uniref:prephenate dehydratase n=1 Tax=Alteribacillus iranensis TaxID=930128 RepID=UPI0011605AE6|nr:prephenate dehydratase [Alteribacillus iranensis]